MRCWCRVLIWSAFRDDVAGAGDEGDLALESPHVSFSLRVVVQVGCQAREGLPSWSRPSSSTVSRSPSTSATTCPSRMTSTRSQVSHSSASSDDAMTTHGAGSRRHFRARPWIVALACDVDALGRLVEQQRPAGCDAATWPARPSAGCRPDSVPKTASERRGRTSSRVDPGVDLGFVRPERVQSRPVARELCRRRSVRRAGSRGAPSPTIAPWPRRSAGTSARPAAHRAAWAGRDRHRPSTRTLPPRETTPKSSGRISSRPDPVSPAMPMTSPRRPSQVDVVDHDPAEAA